jgi:hypothetical protein
MSRGLKPALFAVPDARAESPGLSQRQEQGKKLKGKGKADANTEILSQNRLRMTTVGEVDRGG